jgi:hypothetical protein
MFPPRPTKADLIESMSELVTIGRKGKLIELQETAFEHGNVVLRFAGLAALEDQADGPFGSPSLATPADALNVLDEALYQMAKPVEGLALPPIAWRAILVAADTLLHAIINRLPV